MLRSSLTRTLLSALLLIGLLAAIPAGAQATKIRVGIGDQKPSTFQDPNFRDLHIRYARFLIPWDVMESRKERAETDAWLQAARDAHVRPLITFTRSRHHGRGQHVPSKRRYVRDFKRFRRHWPWVRNFAIWNEANLCSRNPTCKRIGRLVKFYKGVKRHCHRCQVTPSGLFDTRNLRSFVRTFERKLGHKPDFWGLHNYRDANRRRTKMTTRLLNATKAPVWITEIGGLVRHEDKPSRHFRESERHAARTTRWIFKRILSLSRRIKRVYFYNWSVPSNDQNWDSAFFGPDGERPAFKIFRRKLHRLHVGGPRRAATVRVPVRRQGRGRHRGHDRRHTAHRRHGHARQHRR